MRLAAESARNDLLDSYLSFAVEREMPALGTVVRRPQALTAWLRAYAAASSTTASFEAIADAVSRDARPRRATIADHREALGQLYLLDEVPAWAPFGKELSRLGGAPKHQLADPALAARLLRVGPDALISASGIADTSPSFRALRRGPLLGSLFESLATLCVRVYAQPHRANVVHLRTHGGDHEIDMILEREDGRILAIEVKLSSSIDDEDVRHLHWLEDKLGEDVVDRIVLTTGRTAYRRADGTAVVPLALLGP
ncbi:DUF4143 domain-containing protein [Brachybacterium sp. GCM10030267]|uniref:DUF4143 domain-containing protein n=1 Tax=Brachybacterium sp. GCM10030267 TaxID=3273381 RepID=UPI003615E5BC